VPYGLHRFHHSGQSHFITFSCYHRQPNFIHDSVYDLFPICLENMRRRFDLRVYGYVVMPEHVHLLLSEPGQGTLAEAIHYLKLSFTKRLHAAQAIVQKRESNLGHKHDKEMDKNEMRQEQQGSFWQKRYYDRNVRDARQFSEALRYLHRNPVKRGLVKDAADWKWSSFRHYAFREIVW
jgi:putative transposase